jgi:DNA-binding transcriptional ArsR family regulator
VVTGSKAEETLFRAIADPTRRAILGRLRSGGLAAGELAGAFPVTRPAISRHLRVLRSARLVVERRQGRHRIYELDPRPLLALEQWLAGYRVQLRASLARLKAHVENAPPVEEDP